MYDEQKSKDPRKIINIIGSVAKNLASLQNQKKSSQLGKLIFSLERK